MADTERTVGPAAIFALFADEYGGTWESAIGRRVRHRDLGWATIIALEQRAPLPSLLTLRFDTDGSARRFQRTTFHDAGLFPEFDLGNLTGIEVVQCDIIERLNAEEQRRQEVRRRQEEERQREEERQLQQWRLRAQREDARRAQQQRDRENLRLIQTYVPKVRLDRLDLMDRETLCDILRAIDAEEDVSDSELDLLVHWGCQTARSAYGARLYEQEFQRTQNPWDLVRASREWRNAEQPSRALASTANLYVPGLSETDLKAAVFTTRGGAYRDLRDLGAAEQCVRDALGCNPNSFYAYNLWAAVLFQAGNPKAADECFEMARKLGSRQSQGQLDRVIWGSLERADPDARRVSAAYLIQKDRKRYAWVSKYVGA